MNLFMAELSVSDFAASVAWYRDVLGLAVRKLDEANEFALFTAGVAIVAGAPTPGGVRLHFHVEQLERELARVAPGTPIKASDEGYRIAVVRDPDGYHVSLFEWAAPSG